MASTSSVEVPALEMIKDKQDVSLQSYRDDSEHPPAKRQRTDGDQDVCILEGLGQLKLDEIHHIMKYLTPKELLGVMEVSKGWKHFIEGDSLLMNRVVSKFVMRPKLRDCTIPTINKILNDGRPYKHMMAPLIIPKRSKQFKTLREIQTIQRYASTLETLKIDDSSWNISRYTSDGSHRSYFDPDPAQIEACEFPKLQKLKYLGDQVQRLKAFSFPEATHLNVQFETGYFDLGDEKFANNPSIRPIQKIIQILPKFPKLEHLCVMFTFRFQLFNHIEEKFDNEAWSELKELSFPYYYPKFMELHGSTLQILEVGKIRLDDIRQLVENLRVLKSLSIGRFCYQWLTIEKVLRQIPAQNRSVESFKALYVHDFLVDYESGMLSQVLKIFMRSFPSLKELLIDWRMDKEEIEFAASNLIHLERFTCGMLNDGAQQAYQEVRRNPHLFKNSTFDLVVEDDYQFEGISGQFRL